MRLLCLVLCLLATSLHAQELAEIDQLNRRLGEGQVDSYLQNPHQHQHGIPGAFFGSLVLGQLRDEDCSHPSHQTPSPEVTTEIVAVIERTSESPVLENLSTNYNSYSEQVLQELRRAPFTPGSTGLSREAILARAAELWSAAGKTGSLDLSQPQGRDVLLEGLVQAIPHSRLSEKALAQEVGQIIGSVYTSEQDRYNFLSALSARLYLNYNMARNPGFDNSTHNPDGTQLPAGDLSLQGLFGAAATFNRYGGGVCNDISEAVAFIGQELFPDKDVLTVNQGTHVGVLIADGEGVRVIDNGQQMSQQDQIVLNPDSATTNLRISRVVDGKLQQIAVMETQMGQLVENAAQTEKPILRSGADFDSVMFHFNRHRESGGASTTLGVSMGQADLARSQVFVVMARFNRNSERGRVYVSTGATAQDLNSDFSSARNYQVHLLAGASRNLVHYVRPLAEVRLETGAHFSAMAPLTRPNGGPASVQIDMSGGLEWSNRLSGVLRPNSVTTITGNLESRHALGTENQGQLGGTLSRVEGRDVLPILQNLNLHLNQVSGELEVQRQLGNNRTLQGSLEYQGSQVGQSLGVNGGIQVEAPNGAEIFIFTGYTNTRLPGFATQHSLLSGPSGGQVGVNLRTRQGAEARGRVLNINPGGRPTTELGVSIPVGRRPGAAGSRR